MYGTIRTPTYVSISLAVFLQSGPGTYGTYVVQTSHTRSYQIMMSKVLEQKLLPSCHILHLVLLRYR